MAVIHRNAVGWHMECDHCGKVFDSQRMTAQFCTPACRTAAHRAEVRHEERLRSFMQEAASLLRHMKDKKAGSGKTRKAMDRVLTTIQRYHDDPDPAARSLSVYGWNAFEFDMEWDRLEEEIEAKR